MLQIVPNNTNNWNRRIQRRISMEYLEAYGMPACGKDVHIGNIEIDWAKNEVIVYLYGPMFDIVPEGCEAPWV